MRRVLSQPVALTIAGSDSGGGAGLQADLKTLAALGVHGVSALTCITAQNPRRVLAVQPVRAAILRAQLEAIFAGFTPGAVKTGMLFRADLIREVVKFFGARSGRLPLLIVDPVMVATSGAALLQPAALRVLLRDLLPLSDLVTPNVAEAEILAGVTIRSPEDLRCAARIIHQRFGTAVLVKGGHLRKAATALDIFRDGSGEWLLSAPFVRGVSTHGTGCTLSAAIAGYCALGHGLAESVRLGKGWITAAIAGSVRVGRHRVLQPPRFS